MNWNQVQGNWKQMRWKAKEQWGRLTDDDLDIINGRRDQLIGKLQEKYGYSKEQAEKAADYWSKKH
ncbi:MAG: CsbD family protein [Thermodesulfobacteriota bacterium]